MNNKNIKSEIIKRIPNKLYISMRYIKQFKRIPNFKNPKTITEKIQWINLNNKLIKYAYLADKYEVREYVKNKVGEKYLIDLIGCYENSNEINLENMPQKFAIKCTHGCGTNIIVDNKNNIDINEIRNKLNNWMKIDYSVVAKEIHYKYIKPRIICERYIGDNKTDLKDYKFFCFNGKVEFIQVISERNNGKMLQNFYDSEWNELDISFGELNGYKNIDKPTKLSEMVEVAEKLSNEFQFVRVDLYYVDEKILFGELTFTPRGGILNLKPQELNFKLGELISLERV